MFAVEMLPAGHGDALVVEYGAEADPHQLLIDAGTYHAWEGVQAQLMRRRRDKYEVFVVTHVDEDHIGGAISLLDDGNLNQRIDQVWFNGYVHCTSGGNVLGPLNGEQLTYRIARGGFHWNEGFMPRKSVDVGGPVVVPSAGDLPSFDLPGGATVVLLSPTGPKLRAMAKKWVKVVKEAGLGDAGHTSIPTPRDRTFDPLPDALDFDAIAKLAAKRASDRSPANATSIAFVLEYDGKRVLFAADAYASILTDSMRRYAERVGEARPRIDLVKLAHHGSNANISLELLGLIDCRRWLVSTNGDNFAHPDDAAIAKVIVSAGAPVTFYCNYRTARTIPWEERGQAVGAAFLFPKARQRSMRVTV
ncbi:ComEC/Rec2 family competence protein [Lysobacter korlensis]|uniref:ComEC/Rec2 family competence protein n=1 Tax=Lysobacter korlensis TaxID=553636 RepID=A0ABV6S0N7_9GAMM